MGCAVLLAPGDVTASGFRFDRDTLAFANETVFAYHEGHLRLRKPAASEQRPKRYTNRCFVMTRTALQFHKFVRFDPGGVPLNDRAMAERIRVITRMAPWRKPLPSDQRIVFPGYASLRALSGARPWVLQDNIGLGWPIYFRIGNFRIIHEHGRKYQKQTHAHLDATLARGELFVAYLSTFPSLTINHAVLVYARGSVSSRTAKNAGIERYLVYDPNHMKAPRELTWSPLRGAFAFQKDWDFVGGFVRVYQIYGKPLQ